MGFYFRKSVKAGPFRLNFGRRGIGVSAGVKGARISVGPRGAYLSGGAGGLYYRKKIGGGRRAKAPPPALNRQQRPLLRRVEAAPPDASFEARRLHEVDAALSLIRGRDQAADAARRDLLEQRARLSAARQAQRARNGRVNRKILAGFVGVLGTIFLLAAFSDAANLIIAVPCLGAALLLWRRHPADVVL